MMTNYEIKNQLFQPDLLNDIHSRKGQKETDFGYKTGVRLPDEISKKFKLGKMLWSVFKEQKESLDLHQSGTSETRNSFVIPFLGLLGYQPKFHVAEEVEGERFAISYREEKLEGYPIDIVGFKQGLDEVYEQKRGVKASPHVVMQKYLNKTEHLYGIISNGTKIRLLRDHHRLSGIQYMEWDLEQMFESNDHFTFDLLFRLLHSTRMPQALGGESWIEVYHQDSIEEGNRVRDKLRNAVSDSLKILGSGFITHPKNEDFRQSILNGKKLEEQYGRELRKLIYRLLFLLVSEERKLVYKPTAEDAKKKIYDKYYSISRIRKIALDFSAWNKRHDDVWEQLKRTFHFFEQEVGGEFLGISPLGGSLFRNSTLELLNGLAINNEDLLGAIDRLSMMERGNQTVPINYNLVNVEEFGAIYESLLDHHPVIIKGTFGDLSFGYTDGDERKITGSYYTPDDLVRQILKTALIPVLEDRLAEAREGVNGIKEQKQAQERAILEMKVCDPSCGSGHFLVASARVLAHELAKLRAKEGESIVLYYRDALREVIENCVYGVELNPDAVELCRLVLWMEGQVAGKPVSFLDHKIKSGNSLVGWQDKEFNLKLPSSAFNPVLGDDKEITFGLKRKNKSNQLDIEFSQTQIDLFDLEVKSTIEEQLALIKGNTLNELKEKERIYDAWNRSDELKRKKSIFDLWCYAFFQDYNVLDKRYITNVFLIQLAKKMINNQDSFLKFVMKESNRFSFFHWRLEFEEVFSRDEGCGGFDVIVGNPPWEKIIVNEKEYFASRAPSIANAENAAKRKRMIANLNKTEQLYLDFYETKRRSESQYKFIKYSGVYHLGNKGILNTYPIFMELVMKLVNTKGRIGYIIPSGISTDSANKFLFSKMIEEGRLISLYGLTNQQMIFPGVASGLKFSLVTLLGKENNSRDKIEFGNGLRNLDQINDSQKIYSMNSADISLFNPNTHTNPTFQSVVDYNILKKLYQSFPIIINDNEEKNEWNIFSIPTYNISSDSDFFINKVEYQKKLSDFEERNLSTLWLEEDYEPLYEAKFFNIYNHRSRSFVDAVARTDGAMYLSKEKLENPSSNIIPWYYVKKRNEEDIDEKKVAKKDVIQRSWNIVCRKITDTLNWRTFIPSIIPNTANSNSFNVLISSLSPSKQCAFIATISSFTFDYVSRQKLGGTTLSLYVLKQLPIIPPEDFTDKDLQFVVPRVLELVYTAWDLKGFADDVWKSCDEDLQKIILDRSEANANAAFSPNYGLPKNIRIEPGDFPRHPFKWDEELRAVAQAELDAFIAMKFKLDVEELKYILDPSISKLAGPNFSGETFRVLKEKEVEKYNEYRTCQLVLDAWERQPWLQPGQIDLEAQKKWYRSKWRDQSKAREMPLVMAYIIHKHREKPRFKNKLGRTKMEKLLHGIEAVSELDLGRKPIKDEFGPADFDGLKQAEAKGQKLKIFEVHTEESSEGYEQIKYREGEAFEEALQKFESHFEHQLPEIDQLIEQFLEFGARDTELRMTVYAAWSNLILEGYIDPADDMIIRAAREEWHPSKMKYGEDQFREALAWLNVNLLIPNGNQKRVE